MSRKIKYVMDENGLTLTELTLNPALDKLSSTTGMETGTVNRLQIPLGELMDMVQDLTYNNKGLLLKANVRGEVDVIS